MRTLDLFAGIGGFTLGLEQAGLETAAFCEIEPYAQQVLAKNWPEVPIYDDIRSITAERLISDGVRVDIITGGFPCQDLSISGAQAGIEGERSGLWSECARLLRELRPRYAIFENVTNLLIGDGGNWFKRVLWDISSVGYDAEWHCIPASELGAYHHRDRVWIICYPRSELLLENSRYWRWRDSEGDMGGKDAPRKRSADSGETSRSSKAMADAPGERIQRSWPIKQQEPQPYVGEGISLCGGPGARGSYWFPEPDVGRVANGIPSRAHRLKCLGNAVVPPIPRVIGEAIIKHEEKEHEQWQDRSTTTVI